MPFPHPQSRKDHDRNEHKPSLEGIARKFVEGTVDITEDRDAEDNVNPAKNRTRESSVDNVGRIPRLGHDVTPSLNLIFRLFHFELRAYRFTFPAPPF